MLRPTLLLLRARELRPQSGDPAAAEIPGAPALADLAARAWYWPEAGEAIARGRSAVRVVGVPAPSSLDAALVATKEAAARIDDDVVAVVWEPTGLLHDPRIFVDQAADASKDDPPLYLWVRFEGTKGADGTLGMRTTGLAALGAMEIEVEGSARDGEHVLECVTDVALFVLTSAVLPEDGETIEVTRGSLRVRRMPSLRGDGSTALRVRV